LDVSEKMKYSKRPGRGCGGKDKNPGDPNPEDLFDS